MRLTKQQGEWDVAVLWGTDFLVFVLDTGRKSFIRTTRWICYQTVQVMKQSALWPSRGSRGNSRIFFMLQLSARPSCEIFYHEMLCEIFYNKMLCEIFYSFVWIRWAMSTLQALFYRASRCHSYNTWFLDQEERSQAEYLQCIMDHEAWLGK